MRLAKKTGLPIAEALLHRSQSVWSHAVSKDELCFRLRTAKGDVDGVELVAYRKYRKEEGAQTVRMRKCCSDALFDYYTANLKLSDTRIVYCFRLEKGGQTAYYTECGLRREADERQNSYFQYPYITEVDVRREVLWCRETVLYQIFVDRFRRGNFQKDDSYIDKKWDDVPERSGFYGGDLEGIRQSLSYLRELGVGCLYLTPIFRSPSNHKYDTLDYFEIDEMFGTEDDLKALVRDAHACGIRVLLDAVFNHASVRCPQFLDVVQKGKRSEYYDWFIVHGDEVDRRSVNFECFATAGMMPKWNTGNPKVQAYLLSVTEKWMRECDIDGWRLDVADEVSHDFWRAFARKVKSVREDALIIGEVWFDASAWLKGDEFDSVMNYPFLRACLRFFVEKSTSAQEFADELSSLLMQNTDAANRMMLNLLDSHDTARFLTLLGGDVQTYRCALAVLFFYAGMPCVYYGDEIGMRGENDPDCRRGFPWDNTLWDLEILQTVKELAAKKREIGGKDIALCARNGLFVLSRGETTLLVNNMAERLTDEVTGRTLPPKSFCIAEEPRAARPCAEKREKGGMHERR